MKTYIALILISFVLSASACKLPEFGSKPGTSSNSASTQGDKSSSKSGAITASGNARDDLIKASTKFTEVDSFRAVMDVGGKTNMHIEFAFIAPDRYHVKNLPAMETIIIGKDTYIKIGDKWTKSSMDLGKTIPDLRDSFTEEGLKSIVDVEYVGDDSVDGKAALVYRYKGNTVKEAGPYTSKLWVSKDDGLPLKIEVEYSEGMLDKMTTVYDYESEVKIEAPIKN